MLLLLESTTSWAKVLAWLPDAPPNIVPLGKVMVCGFCSSGCCTTSCCGGGCAQEQNTAVIITIVITDNSFFLIKPPIQFLKLRRSEAPINFAFFSHWNLFRISGFVLRICYPALFCDTRPSPLVTPQCAYRRNPPRNPPPNPPKPPPPQLLPPPPKPPKFPRSQPPPPPKFPPLLAPLSKPLKPPPQLREPQEEEAER